MDFGLSANLQANALHEVCNCIMEARCNAWNGYSTPKIIEYGFEQRCWIEYLIMDFYAIKFHFTLIDHEFEFNSRLGLVIDCLANSKQGSHGIKQASHADVGGAFTRLSIC